MTARRGFISPRGVEQAGELAGRPLGKQETFLVRHLRYGWLFLRYNQLLEALTWKSV